MKAAFFIALLSACCFQRRGGRVLTPESRFYECLDFYYDARTFAQLKNDLQRAQFRLRLAKNNGRDLKDLRNEVYLTHQRILDTRRRDFMRFVYACRRRIELRKKRQDERLKKASNVIPMFLRRRAN